ncbi:MAG: sugar ABC transporter ATP-binding protein, partial [Fusobacteriaceae bacterium]
GKINVVEQMGNEEYIYFSIGTAQYTARTVSHNLPQIGYGNSCNFYFNMEKCHLFDYQTEENLNNI